MDLFGFPPPPDRPTRRQWERELRRLAGLLAAGRARDRHRHDVELATLKGELGELRKRLSDLERAGGHADLARAPTRRPELRRFAGGRA
ncbi:MAG: hypothetical protein ACREFN_05990 [Acetobacteraceae bacterium]